MIASGNILITALFQKQKFQWENLYFYCIQFMWFSTENILLLFWNRSRRAWAGQNDIKFGFCTKVVF